MKRNDRTNRMIMWAVIVSDFVLLDIVLLVMGEHTRMFFIISNVALLMAEWKFHSIIHERIVGAGDVVKNLVQLTMTQTAISYILMRHVMYKVQVGWMLLMIGTALFAGLLMLRLIERNAIKRFRRLGRNTRTVTMVGTDSELRRLYEELLDDATTGYRMLGYYADEKLEDGRINWLGTIKQLVENVLTGVVTFGDELYVCLSRNDKETIRLLSRECDKQVTKFYYVPVSVESIGLNFKREYINDIELFTTHGSPLENPANRIMKRGVDVVLATLFLIPTALVYPIVWMVIKIQSPGPILFMQERTGLDGKIL